MTPIVLDLRLYDTVGEVSPPRHKLAVSHAVLNTLIAVELAVRGHLSPGGGFAAGVAGGTALALVLLFGGSTEAMRAYRTMRCRST